MPANRREYNKRETVRHIQSVFLTLYTQKGIQGITVSQLCQACGIAKSTFYLYFEDKFAVLDRIEEDLLSQLQEINPHMEPEDLELVRSGQLLPSALATARFLRSHAESFRAMLGKQGDPRFVFRMKRNIENNFIARFLEVKDSEPSANLACSVFSSSLVGLYTHFLFQLPQASEETLSKMLVSLLRYALFDFPSVLPPQPTGR